MAWDTAHGDHRFYTDIQTYCSSFVGPVRSEIHQSLSTVLWNKCFILGLYLTEISFAKMHITWKKIGWLLLTSCRRLLRQMKDCSTLTESVCSTYCNYAAEILVTISERRRITMVWPMLRSKVTTLNHSTRLVISCRYRLHEIDVNA